MKISKLWFFGLGVMASIPGCTTVTSTNYASFTANSNSEGVPYHLPIAMMKVSAEISRGDDKKYKDIDIKTIPILVPDPDNRFYLKSSNNALFTSKHEIITENGLLSAISTEDDGVTGDIAMALVDSATSILKLQTDVAGAAQGGKDKEKKSVFLNGDDPLTESERSTILNSFKFNTFEFSYLSSEHLEVLPDTDRLLLIKSGYAPLKTSGAAAPVSNPKANIDKAYSGILARTLVPARFSNSLMIDKNRLYQVRYRELGKEIAMLDKSLGKEQEKRDEILQTEKSICTGIKEYPQDNREQLDFGVIQAASNALSDNQSNNKEAYEKCTNAIKQTEGLNTLFKGYKEQKQAYTAKQTDVKNYLCTDENGNARNAGCESGIPAVLPESDRDQIILTQEQGAVLVPDLENIVRVPISRAPFGKTNNKLVFEKGVLTEFETEKPSVGLALAQMVADVLEAIVSIPAEIIQFKIDTTDKSKELAEAQVEYKNEIDRLQGTQQEIAEVQRRTSLIEAELGLEEQQDLQSGVQRRTTMNERIANVIDSENKILKSQEELQGQIEALEAFDVTRQIDRNERQVELINSKVNLAAAHQIAVINSQIELNEKEAELLTSEIDIIKNEIERDGLTADRKNVLTARQKRLEDQTNYIRAQTQQLLATKERLGAKKALDQVGSGETAERPSEEDF